MREVIVQYHGDKGRYPSTLEVLVEEGLLRRVPSDPMTGSDSTWIVVRDAAAPGEEGGIVDVRSGAPGPALDGTSYRDW
jgi:general secretion pathway protein G